jgi:hypothetical protein
MSNESRGLTRIDTSLTRIDTSLTSQGTSSTNLDRLRREHRFDPPERSSSGDSSSDGSTPKAKDRTPTNDKLDFTDKTLIEAFELSRAKTEFREKKKGISKEVGAIHELYHILLDDIEDTIENVRSVDKIISERDSKISRGEVKAGIPYRQGDAIEDMGNYEYSAKMTNESIQIYNKRLEDLASSVSTLNRDISAHNQRAIRGGFSATRQVTEFTWGLPAPFTDPLPVSMEQALENNIHNSFVNDHQTTTVMRDMMNMNIKLE